MASPANETRTSHCPVSLVFGGAAWVQPLRVTVAEVTRSNLDSDGQFRTGADSPRSLFEAVPSRRHQLPGVMVLFSLGAG